jgi:hypothetical protein
MGVIQTQAKAFIQTTNKGYYLQTMDESDVLTASGSSDDALASIAMDSSVYKIMGKKAVVAIYIKEVFIDVVANFALQVSLDGLNWSGDVIEMAADIDPNISQTSVYIADLTNIDAPFWRLIFNNGKSTVGATGTLRYSFAYTK